MHFVVYHFVFWTYSFGSTTKKRKGMISYNQQHETTFMKKHILTKHPIVQHKWKTINLILIAKKNRKNPKKGMLLVIVPSYKIFGQQILTRKMMHNN
jgi:hypothetical protein